MTISDLGGAVERENLDVGQDVDRRRLRPGSSLAADPVARITFFAFTWLFWPPAAVDIDRVHAVLGGPGEPPKAGDDRDLVLLHQELKALDVLVDDGVLAVAPRPSRACGRPTPSMPNSAAFFRWSQISALNSSALVGMQPTCRQVPPSLGACQSAPLSARTPLRESPPYIRPARRRSSPHRKSSAGLAGWDRLCQGKLHSGRALRLDAARAYDPSFSLMDGVRGLPQLELDDRDGSPGFRLC